jgi:hypothetical protein
LCDPWKWKSPGEKYSERTAFLIALDDATIADILNDRKIFDLKDHCSDEDVSEEEGVLAAVHILRGLPPSPRTNQPIYQAISVADTSGRAKLTVANIPEVFSSHVFTYHTARSSRWAPACKRLKKQWMLVQPLECSRFSVMALIHSFLAVEADPQLLCLFRLPRRPSWTVHHQRHAHRTRPSPIHRSRPEHGLPKLHLRSFPAYGRSPTRNIRPSYRRPAHTRRPAPRKRYVF